mmetsp:Transcript_4050/g.25428  ORF Transcript_4050/g.25428 Transcript_4050/m.25428 type:complete len:212 (+) Transcript_4050:2541-3176(+)
MLWQQISAHQWYASYPQCAYFGKCFPMQGHVQRVAAKCASSADDRILVPDVFFAEDFSIGGADDVVDEGDLVVLVSSTRELRLQPEKHLLGVPREELARVQVQLHVQRKHLVPFRDGFESLHTSDLQVRVHFFRMPPFRGRGQEAHHRQARGREGKEQVCTGRPAVHLDRIQAATCEVWSCVVCALPSRASTVSFVFAEGGVIGGPKAEDE